MSSNIACKFRSSLVHLEKRFEVRQSKAVGGSGRGSRELRHLAGLQLQAVEGSTPSKTKLEHQSATPDQGG